ncbi:MAG: hypothetical protein ACTSP4_08605 [Candidatus Hodarchaeales archaeon]
MNTGEQEDIQVFLTISGRFVPSICRVHHYDYTGSWLRPKQTLLARFNYLRKVSYSVLFIEQAVQDLEHLIRTLRDSI